MSYSYKECEAKEYSQCYGYTKEVDVLFKYRNKKGSQVPDEVVKVCLCGTHSRVLDEIHQGNPLTMRGEAELYALHDDLFEPFANKNRMYTLIKVESCIDGIKEDQFYIINGRDTDKFYGLAKKKEKSNTDWISAREEGFFITCLHFTSDDENQFTEAVVEVVDLHGELVLEALAKGLTTFYAPAPEGEMRKISDAAQNWFPRIEENPTIETEYTCEPIPEFIKAHFLKKQQAEKYGEFEECCAFIEYEVDKNIVDWNKIRKNSPHTEKGLFDTVIQLTNALLSEDIETGDIIITKLLDEVEISSDVLFVTYIMANHELYSSSDPKKNLYKNTKLIDLFILFGLEKDLLALAIAGERLRWLSIKQRDHHDILEPNEFVVEYLVPKYIKGTDIIYMSQDSKLTPIEYWHDYDNTTCYIGGGFSSGNDTNEVFEKNTTIRDYLLKHTPSEISSKINLPEVLEEEPIEVLEPEFGCLDKSILKGKSLEYYNKIVIENGHSEAEFVILGFPHLFEQIYTSAVDGKQYTMEYTESLFPGITEMYEQKKQDLRKNFYNAWKFVNNKLKKTI